MGVRPTRQDTPPAPAHGPFGEYAASGFTPGHDIFHEVLPDFAPASRAEMDDKRQKAGWISYEFGAGHGTDAAFAVNSDPELPQIPLRQIADNGSGVAPF